MGNKLYIGNLDFQTTADDLVELLAGAGEVLKAQVITDRETGQSKGFAFVEMADDATALSAITLYNGHVLNGRSMIVNEARAREDHSPRGPVNPGANPNAKFRQVKHKSRGGANKHRF